MADRAIGEGDAVEPADGTAPATATAAGTPNLDLALAWLQRSLDELTEATRRTQELSATSGPSPAASARPAPSAPAPAVAAPPSSPTPTASSTPLLDKLGRDLTKLASEGSLAPVLDREEETRWVIEILCRQSKRNPVLLGPAGSGKTAIVEGVAQRIMSGKVPALLQGVRLVEVPLASLVAGTEYRGQFEERLQKLVEEASRPGIILFFDEIHLLEGAGRSEGGMGADEVLKPALARGDIAVIGATTPEAYRATIERDSALARRFTTVAVQELDKDATRPILRAVRDGLERRRGVRVSDAALDVLLDFADTTIINRRFPDKAIDLLEQAVAAAIVAGRTSVSQADAKRTTRLWSERASSTPTLDRFGRDLVGLAAEGKLGPIIGREREIDAIVEVLLRRTKRNPVLLGRAGSGKTAVVEGLAIRIANGTVPPPLLKIRLFDIPLLALGAAVQKEPTLLSDLLLEARHPSVVVFFDEIHQLASPTVHDLAEALKPPLARGEIACIGATTGEEYQANLEPDAALARRFSVIAIEPMDGAAVRAVLRGVRDSLARARGVRVDNAALDEIVDLADQYLPNRSFPDKGVDLIEQSVAYGISHGLSTIDAPTARAAVAAFVGRPLDPSASISALDTELRQRGLLGATATSALITRLGVSMRGLDARRERPEAVVLLCGAAVDRADPLAASIAANLFGRSTAVIAIDLAGMTEDHSISSLLGSAPGLIGSDRPLPLQELRRTPWQVILFRGIDRCASSIRDTIAAALDGGSFTDAMGRSLPLGAAVVLLTAPSLVNAALSITPDAVPDDPVLRAAVGAALAAATDVITGGEASSDPSGRTAWLTRELLEPLASRFKRQDVDLTFEPGFVAWLDGRLPTDGESAEAFRDRIVTSDLVASLSGPGRYIARVVGDRPTLEKLPDPVPGQ